MGFIIQYGTRITWAIQDSVPNKKSRIHFIKKLTGLFYRLSQKKKKFDWFMGQQGDEVREKIGPPCQKSSRLGWVIGPSKH